MTPAPSIMRTPAETLQYAIARVTEIHQRAVTDGPLAKGVGTIALGEIEESAAMALILLKNLTGQLRVQS